MYLYLSTADPETVPSLCRLITVWEEQPYGAAAGQREAIISQGLKMQEVELETHLSHKCYKNFRFRLLGVCIKSAPIAMFCSDCIIS